MVVDTEVSDTETETTEDVEKLQEEVSTEETETEKPEIEHTPYEKKMFERAKLAEEENKKLKTQMSQFKNPPVPDNKTNSDMSSMDLYALMQNQVPQEDVPEVLKAAKVLGISVGEALKDDLVKTRLSQLAEVRKSAEAASSGKTRPPKNTLSSDVALEMANKGTLPETDEAMEKVLEARYKKK